MSLTKIGSIGINTGIQFAGVTTVSTLHVGSGVTLSSDGDIFTTGVTTATTFVGALTGTASGNTTISNNADNRVITGGSGNALNGESGLTYDGNDLTITGAVPSLKFTESDGDPDYQLLTNSGIFKIHDVTNSADRFLVQSDGTVTVAQDLAIADKIIHTGDTNTAIRFPAADTVTVETGGTERFRITSDGKYQFPGTGGGSGARGLEIDTESIGAADEGVILNARASGNTGQIKLQTNSATAVTVEGNGGNVNVASNLKVAGVCTATSFSGDGSNLTGITGTTINNNADNRLISGSNTANTLNGETNWHVSGSSLALGTTSPAANFHMRNSYVSMRIDSDGSNNHTTFSQITGTGKENRFYFGDVDDDDVGQIVYDHNGDQLKFIVGASERMRLDADGLSFNGDTAAENSLDDYEEGTYTAHFNIENQGNMSMSGRVGRYVKIGQMVTVMGGGTVASVSGATSGTAIQFTNLPFPVHTTSSSIGHPFPVLMRNMDSTGLGNMDGNQPYSFIGRLFTDNTAGRIEAIRADGAQNSVNAGLAVAQNTEIHYMFSYITDS